MAEYVIKKLTESVTMQSVPQAVSKQLVTAEWINAVNDGFKQSINGNYTLIKNQNEALVNVFSGHEQTGRSRFTGIFEAEVVGTGTVAEINIDFGLVETLELDETAWWNKLLDKTIMFVYVKDNTSVEYLHLNCTFYTQSSTTEGLVYTATEKTITLNLVNSLGESVSASTLYGHILPIKINTCVIEEDAVSFTAMSTADKIQSQIDELDAWIGLIELAADEALHRAEAAELSASNSETAALAAQAASELAAEDTEDALAQVNDKVSTTDLSTAITNATNGLLYNGAYDSTTHVITFSVKGSETPFSINLPIESLISNISLNEDNELVLTFEDETTVEIDLGVLLQGVVKSVNGKTPDVNGAVTIPEAVPTGEGQTDGLMTHEDKAKVNGIEAGAQANVKSDWNAASGNAAEILNKPTIPSAQIQSDWNQANTEALDYIKNKPTIPTAGTLIIAGTFTVSVADWSAGTTCTKTITGLTANDDIMLCPTDETALLLKEFGVARPTQDGADLDFTTTTTPDENLVYDYHIYKGVRA